MGDDCTALQQIEIPEICNVPLNADRPEVQPIQCPETGNSLEFGELEESWESEFGARLPKREASRGLGTSDWLGPWEARRSPDWSGPDHDFIIGLPMRGPHLVRRAKLRYRLCWNTSSCQVA